MDRAGNNKLLLGSRDFTDHLIYAVRGSAADAIDFRGEKYVIEKRIDQKDNVELNFDYVHATWRKFKVLLPDDNESFFIFLWNVPSTNEIYIHYKLKKEILEINLCAPEAVSHGHRYNVEEMECRKPKLMLKNVKIES